MEGIISILFSIIIFLSIAYYFYKTRYTGNIRYVDEGFYAYPSWLIYKGETPYKDFYLGYTPAKTYLLAYLFKKFSPSLRTARTYYSVVSIILLFLTSVLTFLIVNNIWLAIFSGVYLFTSYLPDKKIYYPVYIEAGMFGDRTIIALLFMTLLILSDGYKSSILSMVAGMMLLGTFAFGQEAGAWGLIAFLLYITLNNAYSNLEISYFIAGAGIFLILFIYFFIYKKISIKDAFHECIVEALSPKFFTLKRDYPSPLNCLFSDINRENIKRFYKERFFYFIHYCKYYIPMTIVAVAAIFFIDEYTTGHHANIKIILPLLYGSFALYFLYLHPDYSHITRALPVLLPVYSYAFLKSISFINNNLNSIPACFISLTLIYFWFLFILITINDLITAVYNTRSGFDIAKRCFPDEKYGIPFSNDRAISFDEVTRYIKEKTDKDENILILPADPLLYFFTHKRSPVYLKSFLWHNPKHYQHQAMEALEREKTRYIIYNRELDSPAFYPGNINFTVFAAGLYEYIMDTYSIEKKIDKYEIYIRKEYEKKW